MAEAFMANGVTVHVSGNTLWPVDEIIVLSCISARVRTPERRPTILSRLIVKNCLLGFI